MEFTSEELLSGLKNFGLNEREARVYLAMLEFGTSLPGQLALTAKIPQNKIYGILDALIEGGFCTRQKQGRQSLFTVMDPSIAMDAPVTRLKQRVKDAQSIKASLSSIFSAQSPDERTLADIEILLDREAIRRRYLQILQGAKFEVAGFSRSPYAYESRENLAAQFAMGKLIDSRCASRWVYELELNRDNMLVEFLVDNPDAGEIRVVSQLPLKFVMVDRQILITAAEAPLDDEQEISVAIISNPTVIHSFISVFEHFWENSVEFDTWEKSHKSK